MTQDNFFHKKPDTVYDLFVATLGVVPDEYYKEFPLTSVCGKDCAKAVYRAKKNLSSVITEESVQRILLNVEKECDTYIFG